MILNRAAIHRGIARGTVYKNETIDLRRKNPPAHLGIDPKPPARPMRGGFLASVREGEERPSTIFGQRFPQVVPSKVRKATCSKRGLKQKQGQKYKATCSGCRQGCHGTMLAMTAMINQCEVRNHKQAVMSSSLRHMQAESEAIPQKKVIPTGGYGDAERIGTDGLPHAGTVLYPGQGYYSTVEPISGVTAERVFELTNAIALQPKK